MLRFLRVESVIAREFLLTINTSLAIATSGLRTNLLFEIPPFQKPPIRFSQLIGVSRALQARNPERVSKESPGAFRPWGPKSVRNSLETVSGVSKQSILRLRKGVFRRGFLQNVLLSWLWRSKCQMYCWDQYPWVFLVSLAVTLYSTETPFTKTPLSWFLIFEHALRHASGSRIPLCIRRFKGILSTR